MFKLSPQALRKILPREHGATIIWLSSFIVALLSLREPPDIRQLILFLSSSTAFLEAVSLISRSSPVIIRAERNPTLLPLISCSLTLVAPLGSYLMANQITAEAAAIWLMLVTYTGVSVLLARRSVRNIVFGVREPIAPIALVGTLLLAFESILFTTLSWVGLMTILSILPLQVAWLLSERIGQNSAPEKVVQIARIKKTGFSQTGNMLAFATVLSVLSKI